MTDWPDIPAAPIEFDGRTIENLTELVERKTAMTTTMPSIEVKFCKDCRWFDGRRDCLHEKSIRLEGHEYYVFGEGQPPRYEASAMRAGICGRNAELFEPKWAKNAPLRKL
jgi:hypothetical protein